MSMNGFGFGLISTSKGRKGSGPNRENVRNERTTFPNVTRRRLAAQARQKEADARKPEDQLLALDLAGLVATKERAKLAKRIAERDAKAAAQPTQALKPLNVKNLNKRSKSAPKEKR